MIEKCVPLKDYCTYKTGGIAEYFAAPRNACEMRTVFEWIAENSIRYEILGSGSNVLISDSGYNGLIVYTGGMNTYIMREGLKVTVGAGINLNTLARYAVKNALKGLELLSGIPGSVGGAVKMNAGAYGAEMKEVISEVLLMDEAGREYMLSNAECRFGYRHAEGIGKAVVLEAIFMLTKGDAALLEATREETMQKRREKQPLEKPSCGSVFKRPAEGYAGEYIEKAGLKGMSYGGAQISEKHANFIVNNGGATSADIKYLIDYTATTVKKKFDVTLEPEVKFIGF